MNYLDMTKKMNSEKDIYLELLDIIERFEEIKKTDNLVGIQKLNHRLVLLSKNGHYEKVNKEDKREIGEILHDISSQARFVVEEARERLRNKFIYFDSNKKYFAILHTYIEKVEKETKYDHERTKNNRRTG